MKLQFVAKMKKEEEEAETETESKITKFGFILSMFYCLIFFFL